MKSPEGAPQELTPEQRQMMAERTKVDAKAIEKGAAYNERGILGADYDKAKHEMRMETDPIYETLFSMAEDVSEVSMLLIEDKDSFFGTPEGALSLSQKLQKLRVKYEEEFIKIGMGSFTLVTVEGNLDSALRQRRGLTDMEIREAGMRLADFKTGLVFALKLREVQRKD